MEIKIKVTKERWKDTISIDDEMHFLELTNREAYDYMVQFVINEAGEYLESATVRKMFKKIPAKELDKYVSEFVRAVSEAFVNPTKGADSP